MLEKCFYVFGYVIRQWSQAMKNNFLVKNNYCMHTTVVDGTVIIMYFNENQKSKTSGHGFILS